MNQCEWWSNGGPCVYWPGLFEFVLERSLGDVQLAHLVRESVLHVVTTQLHVRPVRPVLESSLRQLRRVDLRADRVLDASDFFLQVRNLFLRLKVTQRPNFCKKNRFSYELETDRAYRVEVVRKDRAKNISVGKVLKQLWSLMSCCLSVWCVTAVSDNIM